MECPKGSMCTESNHEVKGLATAMEWWPSVTESDLPIRVKQLTAANGRVHIEVRDKSGRLRHMRG